MKKLLLLIFIFITFHGFAQQPDRNDVPELVNQAKIMLEEDASSTEGRKYLRIALESAPMYEEVNYLLAKSHLNDAPSHYVFNYISKAIQVNPSNLEYRWMRFKATPSHDAPEETLLLAKRDLEYILENGNDGGMVNYYLGTVNNNLGDYWFYKPLSKNYRKSDNSVIEENEEKSNNTKALSYYKSSKLYFEKSIEIEPELKEKIFMKLLLNRINQINNNLAQL